MTLCGNHDYTLSMTLSITVLAQFTVIAIFLGLAVYLGRKAPARVILTINAFAAGTILYFIVMTMSNVFNRAAELVQLGNTSALLLNPVMFVMVCLLGLVGIPLTLVFAVGERRRSVIIAIAFGLLNLGLFLNIGSNVVEGLYAVTIATLALLSVLFLFQGLSIGALLMRTEPALSYVITLGLIAALPALIGFNIPSVHSLDFVSPFVQATAAGFMIFYLPFIMAVKTNKKDVTWQFIGMLTGLALTGVLVTALPLLAK